MTKAKIVCTIGPASASSHTLAKLILSGMDVARLNFSHGAHSEHKKVFNTLRTLSKQLRKPVAVLADLQGPKMRVGTFKDGAVTLKTGGTVFLTNTKCTGTSGCIYVPYTHLVADVREGDRILMDDGLLRLRAEKKLKNKIQCRILEGGVLKDHKSIHLPHISSALPILTEKDKDDLTFALSLPVDYIALSFVRSAADVLAAKKFMARKSCHAPIIAKLEHPQAIENLEDILAVSDGVMVARGDLGIEVSLIRLPLLQKKIVLQANQHKIPVIVATQMLESMIEHPIPTRAEITDVANAILDGADAVMLSAETASGRFPVEAVKVMDGVIREVEKHASPDVFLSHAGAAPRKHHPALPFPDAISFAARQACDEVHAKAIVAFTQSGLTARMISKYKPSVPVYAFTHNKNVLPRLSLYYGVVPFYLHTVRNTDRLIAEMDKFLLQKKLVKKNDILLVLLGAPASLSGTTNLMKLHRVGGV